MSFLFTSDYLYNPLIGLSYLFFEEEMEEDCSLKVQELPEDDHRDIEVLACFRELQAFSSHTVAGRLMVAHLTGCVEENPLLRPGMDQEATKAGPPTESGDRLLDNHPEVIEYRTFISI